MLIGSFEAAATFWKYAIYLNFIYNKTNTFIHV